jgi:type II secretory pathway component PulK
VSSRYFLVRAEARVGSARALLSSVLQRPDDTDDDDGKGAATRILLRSFGQDD